METSSNNLLLEGLFEKYFMNADFEIRVQFKTLLRSLLKLEETRETTVVLFVLFFGLIRNGREKQKTSSKVSSEMFDLIWVYPGQSQYKDCILL